MFINVQKNGGCRRRTARDKSWIIGAGLKETANKHELTRSVCLSHFLAAAA